MNLQPRLGLGIFPRKLDAAILAAIVDENDLPVLKRLTLDPFEAGLQKPGVIVTGNKDRHAWHSSSSPGSVPTGPRLISAAIRCAIMGCGCTGRTQGELPVACTIKSPNRRIQGRL